MIKKRRAFLLAAVLALVACAAIIFTTWPGVHDNTTAYAGDWGATDPAKWEAQYHSIDWITPDIVFVGHLTTTLTQPLFPEDTILHVDSTDGFRESGWVKVRSESINYKSKTKTTFEGCERPGDIKTPVRVGTIVAMTERGYYQKGDTETYNIRFHMGDGEQECTDMLTVETWVDETKAWMPIKKKLADLKTVVLISNMAGDNLKATRYDEEKNEIYVEGFKPDSKRVLTIKYQGFPTEAWYDIIVMRAANNWEDYAPPPDGFENWVTLDSPGSVLLKPGETKEIAVKLMIPKEAVVPSQRFMFWVWVANSRGDLTYTTAVAVTWMVNMGR